LPEAEKISEKYCNDNECKIQLLTELNDSEVRPEVTEIIEYENKLLNRKEQELA
jgi:hypothetical protein